MSDNTVYWFRLTAFTVLGNSAEILQIGNVSYMGLISLFLLFEKDL